MTRHPIFDSPGGCVETTGNKAPGWKRWPHLFFQPTPSDRVAAMWRPAILALIMALPILTIPIAAPDLDVDSSWCGVLDWAHQQKAQFGPEIAFTHGPLGYLLAPYALHAPETGLILANMVFCFAAMLGLCVVGSRLALVWRCLLFALFVLETANTDVRTDIVIQAGLLSWSLAALHERPARPIALTMLGVFAGFAALTKVLYLFSGALCVTCVAAALLLNRRRRSSVLLVSIFVASFLIFWVATGQHIVHLPLFVMNSFRFSSAYARAAALAGLPLLRTGGVCLGLLAFFAVAVGALQIFRSRNRADQAGELLLVALLGGFLILCLKHSLVRMDRVHFMELAVIAPAIAIATETIPRYGPARVLSVILSISCAALSLCIVQLAFLPSPPSSLRQVLSRSWYNARWFCDPVRSRADFDSELKPRRDEAQIPHLRELIGSSSVDVFGPHQAYALLNGLTYRPRPVFQSYLAYDRKISELNEAFYLSANAPDYVLFELAALEHRWPPLDDALALRALVINYELVADEPPFLLLKRKSARPAALTLIQEGTASWSEVIPLPDHETNGLWAEIEVEPSLSGRFVNAVYRPAVVRLSIWEGVEGNLKRLGRRQAAPSELRSGFMLFPFLATTQAAKAMFNGQPTIRPKGFSLESGTENLALWNDSARFRLYRIENMTAEKQVRAPIREP